jgi:hypothetical protein
MLREKRVFDLPHVILPAFDFLGCRPAFRGFFYSRIRSKLIRNQYTRAARLAFLREHDARLDLELAKLEYISKRLY